MTVEDAPTTRARAARSAQSAAHAASRLLLPTVNPAGTVYGTLAVGVLLAAESTERTTALRDIGAVLAAMVVYWLGHAYADGLAHRLSERRSDDYRGVVRELNEQWTIIRGAVVPIVVFGIVLCTGASTHAAVIVALASSIVLLLVFETLVALRGQLRSTELVKQVVVCLGMCACILLVKFIL